MAKGYAKIYRRLWDDEVFQTLGAHDKLATLYLLTRCSNRVGIFVVQFGEMGEHLGTDRGKAVETTDRLSRAFRWAFDRATRTLWVRSWWKWNPPESPKALKGFLTDLAELPRSNLLTAYLKSEPKFERTFSQVWREATDRLSADYAIEYRYHEHEHEHENEHEQEHESSDLGNVVALPRSSGDFGSVSPETATQTGWTGLFGEFWQAYPHWRRRSNRKRALAAWLAIKPRSTAMLKAIADGLQAAKASPDWTKNGGEYVPAAERWLRNAGWDASNGNQRASQQNSSKNGLSAAEILEIADKMKENEANGAL